MARPEPENAPEPDQAIRALAEILAMRRVLEALAPLRPSGRRRVLNAARELLLDDD